jgi:hypothetical protein
VRVLSEALRIPLDAQQGGRPVSPETLAAWREQLANVDAYRAQLDEQLAVLWRIEGRHKSH